MKRPADQRRRHRCPLGAFTIAFALLGLLAGCGINALRTDYARTVADDGRAVASASQQFLERVDEARLQANIEMVAADPACGQSPALVRQEPRVAAQEPLGWLCMPRGSPADAGSTALSLRPASAEFEPTLQLIAALTAYSEALAEIVDAEPADPMKPLIEALTLARTAQGTLLAISGGERETVPAPDDPRVKAIADFVGFLNELSHEAGQVRRLRALAASNPQGAGPVIASLRDHLATWNNSRRADEVLRRRIHQLLLQRIVESRPPASAAARREAMTDFYRLEAASRASRRIYPALDNLLVALDESDRDLRRILGERPDLTRKERDRVAEINRQRVARALENVTAVITSFRGA